MWDLRAGITVPQGTRQGRNEYGRLELTVA
jgi:hypothetical protein